MILAELKAHIFEKGSATREELAKKFALSEDGVDAMLEVWVKKGRLSRIEDTNKQGKTVRVRYRAVRKDDIQMNVIA